MAHALSAKFTQSIATRALANTRNTRHTARLTTVRPMASITIVDGVDFTHIAREFRCKWSADNDKASLAAAQKVLNKHLPALKAKGEVQRTVCGGCLDFKVNTRLAAEDFGAWEAAGFAPEAEFLADLAKIDGITNIETQTYTLMPQ